jgi:hypothetical protein
MDRISALRNIEDALSDFESGSIDLETMETRVRATLRTYATDFDELSTYRVREPPSVDGLIVVADSLRDARDRIRDLIPDDIERFEVEPVEE